MPRRRDQYSPRTRSTKRSQPTLPGESGRTRMGGRRSRPPPPNRAKSPEQRGQVYRSWIAEENVINEKVACGLLEKQGHQIVVACNGREALSILEAETFDLALLDVQMPEVDGLETARAIRARERNGSVRMPLIAVTA